MCYIGQLWYNRTYLNYEEYMEETYLEAEEVINDDETANVLDEKTIIDDFNEFEENSRNKWHDLFDDIKDKDEDAKKEGNHSDNNHRQITTALQPRSARTRTPCRQRI